MCDKSTIKHLRGDQMKINVKMQGLNQAVSDIRKYSESKIEGVKRVIVESTVNIQNDAVSLVPVKEGNLKNSIDFNITNNGLGGEVFASAEYAADVEFGTKPHKIEAKNGGVLAFKKDGKMIFAKSVKHPGTPAQPYLFPAWEAEMPKYKSALQKELNSL